MKKGGFFYPFFMFKPFLNLANKRIGKDELNEGSLIEDETKNNCGDYILDNILG